MRINLQIKNIQLLGAVTGCWQTTKSSKIMVQRKYIFLNYISFKTPHNKTMQG